MRLIDAYAVRCDRDEFDTYTDYIKAFDAINEAPTVDAVPVRHGKWITEECLPGVAVCSNCGHEIRGIGCQYTKYCEECGCRMDEE